MNSVRRAVEFCCHGNHHGNHSSFYGRNLYTIFTLVERQIYIFDQMAINMVLLFSKHNEGLIFVFVQNGNDFFIYCCSLSNCLIQVSHVLHHTGRNTSERINLQLLTEESKSPEGVSVSRSSLGSKMLQEKVQISFIQIMISST